MKKTIGVLSLFFFAIGYLHAQESNSSKFDPIIKKLGEATRALKENLSPSEAQKAQAKELFDKIKGNFGSFQEGFQNQAQKIPNKNSEAPYETRLSTLRGQIDTSDDVLIKALADRMDAVREIGALKKAYNKRSLQPDRWKAVVEKAKKMGAQKGLSENFVEKVMNAIHRESLRIQDDTRSKRRP